MKNLKEKKKQNYVVKQTEYFREELYEILEYMRYNLYTSTMIKFINQVVLKLDCLVYFPKMYVEYYKNSRYRRIVIGNYMIFYKINEKDKIVEIVHIYYSRKISFNLN